jgi:hypothetical protein
MDHLEEAGLFRINFNFNGEVVILVIVVLALLFWKGKRK